METKFPHKWPLALDVLKRQYDANSERHLMAFQSKFFDKLGPNMELKLFGAVGYMTIEPKNVEAILSTKFEGMNLQLEKAFLRKTGIFGSTLERCCVVHSLCSCNGIVDLQPFFFRFTLATTTALIFGQPVGSIEGDEGGDFANSFDYASMICAFRLRLADLYWAYTPSKYTKACKTIKDHVDDLVKQVLKHREYEEGETTSNVYSFIHDLFDELKDPILLNKDFLTLIYNPQSYLLVRHPAVLDRLRTEIQSITSLEDDLTRAQIVKMPYLKCVLNETLRLYPQLPVNVRVATKTTFIPHGGGPDRCSPVLIRRGTGIGYSVYHMHRRKDLYGDDARDFRPERWEENDLANTIGWGFMPFHGGPRICLGKDFALMEASCAIIRIIQTFPNLRLPPGLPQEPTGLERQSLTIVISSADGCKVLLR
ncbi:hypothetical protein MMC07_000695 [Pseudocyphellaria aurata]|nr:hypothetical protein [Pseudocyphellaria aurata]